MTDLKYPVAHLENTDFDSKGNLINPQALQYPIMVVMAQSSWCGHCKTAKPAYQEFANKKNGSNILVATIQVDGERPSEKALGKRIGDIIPGFRGFPEYALFKDGKFVTSNISGRGVSDLERFARM